MTQIKVKPKVALPPGKTTVKFKPTPAKKRRYV